MRYVLALAAAVAVASATNYEPCGNVCANGAAPSKYFSVKGQMFAACPDTDFTGSDLEGNPISDIDSFEKLAEACLNKDGCIAGTFSSGNFGYLKNGIPATGGVYSPDNDSVFKVPDSCQISSTTTTAAATSTTSSSTASVPPSTTPSAPATTPSTSSASVPPSTTPSAPATTSKTSSAVVTTVSTTSTTVRTYTTSTTSTPSATPPPTCPKDYKDIITIGGQSFYKFFSGECSRNSFQYSHYTSFPKETSAEDAIQKCAAWIAAKDRTVFPANFQLFFYKPDQSWHCDATRTLNTDWKFTASNIVSKMWQYNPLPQGCAPPPPPPQSCPPPKTVIKTTCGKQPYSFSLFFGGYAKRNDFAWKTYESYPGWWPIEKAIASCADFTAKQIPSVAQTFQVFYYNPDCKWHCDTSATVNTNSNFKDSKDVKQIVQFNAVSSTCPSKRSFETVKRTETIDA